MLRILSFVVLSGLITGTLISFLQKGSQIRLIQQAELFEDGPVISYENHLNAETSDHQHVIPAEHHEPLPISDRFLKTWVMNCMMTMAWGLFIAMFLLISNAFHWSHAVFASIVGCYSFFIAPNLGLHPELPGSTAAPLESRQLWWLLTSCSSIVGCLVLKHFKFSWGSCLGLGFMALPFLIGAPQPEFIGGSAPRILADQFIQSTWINNIATWAILGLIFALGVSHLSEPDTSHVSQ